jgi:hypothetical protein
MKYIKIRILEWRDKDAFALLQKVGTQARAAQEKADAARGRAKQMAAELAKTDERMQLPSDQTDAHAAAKLATQLTDEANALQVIADKASADNSKKSFTHKMCGTFGYQLVDDQGYVESIVDEHGAPYSADAIYGSEVADANPPTPSWAKA